VTPIVRPPSASADSCGASRQDAHPVGHVGHALLAEVGGQLGKDRVFGGDQRLIEVEVGVEAAPPTISTV